MKTSIIVLSFNSTKSIEATLQRAAALSDDVWVVDSFSSDDTVSIARRFGAHVLSHEFANYGAQRNWAIEQVHAKYRWQLHVDADEVLSMELIAEIRALPEESEYRGYLIPRYLRFLGRDIKHGGMSPTWHLRLFETGTARCEARLYDQHFYLLEPGKTAKVRNAMIDVIAMSLSEWTVRHNRWADLEVGEQSLEGQIPQIQPRLFGSPIERKRLLRKVYTLAPAFSRPFGLFFYRYFVRLGVFDGKAGLIYWTLQTFWFRFLIDAKLYERNLTPRGQNDPKGKVVEAKASSNAS